MELRIKDVAFSYSSRRALQDVSFAVGSGELIGVVGPNGSGKSTLLSCINGVLKPSEGAVLIDERSTRLLTRREIARTMAVVPQHSPIAFSFSALDLVLMGREAYLGQNEREGAYDLEVARRAMEQVGVLHLAGRMTAQMSGGEMQRVIVARALAQEPQVLLLDEPTLHLDVRHQFEILELVKRLTRKRGLVAVLVCHDLNLVARYCDRVVMLRAGQIVAAGTPTAVLTGERIAEVYGVEAEVDYVSAIESIQVTFLPGPPRSVGAAQEETLLKGRS